MQILAPLARAGARVQDDDDSRDLYNYFFYNYNHNYNYNFVYPGSQDCCHHTAAARTGLGISRFSLGTSTIS